MSCESPRTVSRGDAGADREGFRDPLDDVVELAVPGRDRRRHQARRPQANAVATRGTLLPRGTVVGRLEPIVELGTTGL